MSVPASIATAVTGAATIANPMDILMASINTNPYFIGVMMLLLNLGGRFLSLEITKEQEKVLSRPAVRRFFLFAVLFVATRNIVVALGLTVIVVLVLGYLFNENSDLCLWKPCTLGTQPKGSEPQASYSGLTSEEVMILKRLQDKQMAAQKKDTDTPEVVTPFVNASQVYTNAINTLRGTF